MHCDYIKLQEAQALLASDSPFMGPSIQGQSMHADARLVDNMTIWHMQPAAGVQPSTCHVAGLHCWLAFAGLTRDDIGNLRALNADEHV